jgi:polar amino acid transport system substrate-binding protein
MKGKMKSLYLIFAAQALANLHFKSITNSRIGLPWSALKLLLVLNCLSIADSVLADVSSLRADYRQRPPEMVVDEKSGHFFGPLIDILDEAARKIDYRIKWRKAPFQRSYNELQLGSVDVVPRVILTEERKAFVAYLGPIGYQRKDIVFLVRKGQEGLINTYDDLRKISIGTKRDTAYFKRFNDDKSIHL